nr:oligomeric golgi complex subunit 7 [Hymenolepis microstoma]
MSSLENDSENNDDIDEGCTENYKCLLCDNNSNLIQEFFEHLSSSHQWNLKEEKRLFDDHFLWITFVNWARKTKPERFSDFYELSYDQRMLFSHPVIEDDDVLMIDVETLLGNPIKEGTKNLEEIQKENESLRLQIAKCRELINELANSPNLDFVKSSEHASHSYGQSTSSIVSTYRPAAFLIDKFSLNGLQNSLSKNFETFIRDKTILNCFIDGGLLSVFAAKSGAKKILIQESNFSEIVLSVARANGVEDKIEVTSSPRGADVLFCDWMSPLFRKSAQSQIFSLIQSNNASVFPPIACMQIIGVNVTEALVKSLIPPSSYLGSNMSPLVQAAYNKVYHGNWSGDFFVEVTREREFGKIDIRKSSELESLCSRFSLSNLMTKQINGFLISFHYENDKGEEIINSRFSQFLGQSLILLRKPIDVFEKSIISGDIHFKWNNSIEIDIQDTSDMHIDNNSVIRELERLDCERQRVKKAADALREANRWSMLVNSRQALMEGDANVDQLFQLIIDMDQSLVYMEQMPDYANRKALVSSTKDRLETLMAPQFMEVLDSIAQSNDPQLVEGLVHMISIFAAMNRSSVAVQYYVTWMTNHMKEDWEKPCGHSLNLDPTADQEIQRVQAYFTEVITFLNNQMRSHLFKDDSQTPLLKAISATLEVTSPQIGQTLYTESVPVSKRLTRCSELLKFTQHFADQLCCLLCTADDAKLELYFEIARKLYIPLGAVSEIFRAYAIEILQETLHILKPSYNDDTQLLNDLQLTSDQLIKRLEDLLNSAVVQTKGIALPSLLDAIHQATNSLFKQWGNTLDRFTTHLIEQDREMKYEQACGMNTSLALVTATGAFSREVTGFLKKFDQRLSVVFQNVGREDKTCSKVNCPFHSLLLPLIGEVQSSANWSILFPLAPQNDWLKPPVSDASEPITSIEVLLNQLVDLSKTAGKMAQNVALTPVEDILTVVPKLSVWASHPASGEATLPDLAYLPQEYVTQLGQYIFNLPEHLLPFMDTNEDTNSAINVDQGASLVYCLRLTDFCKTEDQIAAVAPGIRSRLLSSSSVEAVSSPATITAWLDWLLSGQVAEAFVKAVLGIPSPLHVSGNGGQSIPGLTPHGAKQLVTDLDYFLGLLEELGLPQPGDLTCLRDLVKASPEEFKSLSVDKSPRLVAGACSTAASCEAERKLAGPKCMREWYMDWRCVECCQGELCNYYATLSSSKFESNIWTATMCILLLHFLTTGV